MDALKIISEGSIKAERPQFNVLRAPSLPRSTAALLRPLPSAALLTAWASSVSSPSTAPSSRR